MLLPSLSVSIALTLLNLITHTLSHPLPLPIHQSLSNRDSNPGTWHTLPPIALYPRQEHSTVYLPPYIYILGGVIPSPSNSTADPFTTVPFVQRFSLQTQTWSSAADLPLPLAFINAAVINGKIYVIGGLTPGNGIWTASRATFIYEPETNIWTRLNDIPEGLQVGAAAVGVRGDTIYLAGGLKDANIQTGVETSVNLFTAWNVGTQIFTSLPPLPAPRDHAGAAFIAETGTFYVLGGRAFGRDNVVDTTYVFSFQTLQWKEGAKMPSARGGVASAVVGTQIFVIGGEGNKVPGSGGVFAQNEAYDTGTDTWREYKGMDVPRHGTSAVAIGNRIYIPGGGTAEGEAPTSFFGYFEVGV